MKANSALIALETGAIAAGATTAAVAIASHVDTGEMLPGINAVSHIAWGDVAATHDEVSAKYTGLGAALNAFAIGGWALLHVACFRKASQKSLVDAVALGAVTSTTAYITDYHIVPKRFTPGFEKVVKPHSMLAIYSVLGVALGVGTWLSIQHRKG